MMITQPCKILFVGKINKAAMHDSDNIKKITCTACGANKKSKGGTTGKSLEASHTFHEIIFAKSQKKQMSRVIIIFFEGLCY